MRPAPRNARRNGLLPFWVTAAWLCGCSLVLPWGGYTQSVEPTGDAATTDSAVTSGPRDAMEAETTRTPTADANCGMCTAPATCGGAGVPDQCGCTPKTCSQLGAMCGTVPDGCGGTAACGACPASMTCGLNNQCGAGPCKPATCASLGDPCGVVSDGCGGTLTCAACTPPLTCGGGGSPNRCGGCTPTSCAALGAQCGAPSDGCGGTLSCGTCIAPATCGGTPGVCSTPASTCGALQLFQVASVMLSGADVPIAASSPAQCQQYCNSMPGTVCCLWFLNVTYNGIMDPCVAYVDPTCINDWQALALDATAPDGAPAGSVWAVACQ